MTEYLIFGVSYSKEEEHIDWVLVGREVNNKLVGVFITSREFVVDLIKAECASFRTATCKDQKYRKGAEVVLYNDKFLTTTPDASEENNLESLPSFLMPEGEIDAAVNAAAKDIFSLPD